MSSVLPQDMRLVGVVHLPALPGAPRHEGNIESVVERAVRDASTLREGGMQGVIVENYGDAPFYKDGVPVETIAAMTRVVSEVVHAVRGIPVGVNVLRNDAAAAVAVAMATGAAFVRVNVHTGAAWTDQGLVEGRAHETLRLRARLGAQVGILADVGVKHAVGAGGRSLADEAADCALRGGADALIVTGAGTGRPAAGDDLNVVKRAAGGTPVFVGSGVTPETVAAALASADGVIVGSCLRADGRAGGPVDVERVRALVAAAGAR